ncbi:MAG TPA: prolyl oligopeptidase family serine peptidase [Rhizomicrobium sp.]|nr:prolyl oligopeptidase family serine peptidase [Rhizomicrobium sp.]
MALAGQTLAGPTMAPAQGPATHLVVLVHGYGADGQDLIGLVQHWQSLLPTVAFAAPNAPTPIPGGPGYQWFPISRIDPHEMRKGVEAAGPVLDEYLDAELARLGLPPDRLALAGFSQGTMLSLHLGLRRRIRPAAIVGFSGLLAGPPPEGEMPPILLTHGDSDSVIPPQAMFAAAAQLGLAGAAVQWHLAPGMGHGIDPDGLMIAGQFLNLAFRGLLKNAAPIRSVYKPS